MKKKNYNPIGMSYDEYEEKYLTPEEKTAIDTRVALMEVLDGIKEKENLTQNELSKLSGVSQPVISRLFNSNVDSNILTLLKVLIPLGYTIKIVPINENV